MGAMNEFELMSVACGEARHLNRWNWCLLTKASKYFNYSIVCSAELNTGVAPISRTPYRSQKESEMTKRKTPYPKEFRQQMVELVQAGRQPKDLAKEFGCHVDSIRGWVAQLALTQPGPTPLNASERQELIELRRKYKQLQQERDILAKATAWFANNGAPTSTMSTR